MTTTLEDAIDQLNKLYQGKTLYGALFAANTTNQQVSGVDTTTNTFTSNAHNLINGCRVKFSSSNQLPNPLDATTTYLVSSAGNSIVAIDSRNYKPEEDDVIETPSPYFKIKVLFYLQTDKGYDFYIGGDRPTPIKIYSATTYPLNIYLSNLGRGLNDWVIGIHAVSDSDIEAETGLNDYIGHFVTNIFGGKSYTCTEPWAASLNWIGDGFWQAYFENSSKPENAANKTGGTLVSSVPWLTGFGGYGEGGESFTGNAAAYSFLRAPDSISNDSGYSYSSSSHEGSTGDTFIQINASSTNRNYPVFVFPEISINGYLFQNFNQKIQINYHDGGSDNLGSYTNSTTEQLEITPCIVDLIGKNYFYTNYQVHENSSSESSDPPVAPLEGYTLIESAVFGNPNQQYSLDNTHRENTNTGETIPTPADAININYGATLRQNKFFLVPPPANSKDVYQTGLWSNKKIKDYSILNIYDNPDKTKGMISIPVWVAQLGTQSIQVQDDAVAAKVFPLLKDAIVVAASYYP